MKDFSTGAEKSTLGVIYYFISRLDGVLGKTHLQKLLFLSDLIATKRHKEKITSLDFKRYKHGPYAGVVNSFTERLQETGFISAQEFKFGLQNEKSYTRYHVAKHIPIKEKLVKDLGVAKVLILDEVIDSFGNISLQNLLDVVYELPEVKDSKMMDELLSVAKKSEATQEEVDSDPF